MRRERIELKWNVGLPLTTVEEHTKYVTRLDKLAECACLTITEIKF